MKQFKFIEFGENLGTRQLGNRVRNILLPLVSEGEKVILDFSGVNVVSNSFADECLGKLLLYMPIDDLKKKTTFVNLNDFAKRNIALAFKRRIKRIQAERRVDAGVK